MRLSYHQRYVVPNSTNTPEWKWLVNFVISLENSGITNVDGKVKKELKEMLWSKQQKLRERHLKTKANGIRKILKNS